MCFYIHPHHQTPYIAEQDVSSQLKYIGTYNDQTVSELIEEY